MCIRDRNECARYGVEIRYETEATSAMIEELRPQIVILATGAKPFLLPIEGKETMVLANDVLNGDVNIPSGNVAIIGGGMVGMETAEYILHHARGNASVTLIEMMDTIGQGMVPNNLVPTMKRFKQEGVQMITSAKVKSIQEGTITVETKQGEMCIRDREYIEAGRIQFFCCDSIDKETWSNECGDPRERIEQHERWYNYIVYELVAMIYQINTNAQQGIMTSGCSMGAFHALNVFLRRPDIFTKVLGCLLYTSF